MASLPPRYKHAFVLLNIDVAAPLIPIEGYTVDTYEYGYSYVRLVQSSESHQADPRPASLAGEWKEWSYTMPGTWYQVMM